MIRLLLLYFCSFFFQFLACAGMDSSLEVYKKFLKGKASKQALIKSFNRNLYLSYPVRDVELVNHSNKLAVHWFLETDDIAKTIKLAKSKYKKPYSDKRLVRTLEALQSFKKVSRAIASIPQQEHKLAVRSLDKLLLPTLIRSLTLIWPKFQALIE